MWTETRLILASGNAGKHAEFARLFQALGTDVIRQSKLGIDSPEETGLTFIENALLKARHASRLANAPALADDSGLVVPALDGAPGLYSARYAGVGASDQDNIDHLLSEMTGLQGAERRGHYLCALALLRHAEDPDPIIAIGKWHGEILPEPRGDGGFGYDPLFLPEGLSETAAEMTSDVKNRISHRGKAVQLLLAQLT